MQDSSSLYPKIRHTLAALNMAQKHRLCTNQSPLRASLRKRQDLRQGMPILECQRLIDSVLKEREL